MLRALLPALVALVLLGACGGEDEPAGGTAPVRPDAPSVELRIRHVVDGEQRSRATLTCTDAATDATGYLADRSAGRLCAEARRLRGLLTEPPPGDRVCTQIYGGPDIAVVSGRIGTEEIRRRFTRRNGCEIADWERAQALLPEPVGAGRG